LSLMKVTKYLAPRISSPSFHIKDHCALNQATPFIAVFFFKEFFSMKLAFNAGSADGLFTDFLKSTVIEFEILCVF
jgi:hypothetical protein